MQITPANLAAMFYAFNQQFNEGMKFAQPWQAKVATEVPSTGESLIYPFLDRIPKFRQWFPNQERVAQNASLRGYTLINNDYELTIEVDRNKIEDDLYGAYAPLIQQMGMQSVLWPDDLVAAVMQAGSAAGSLCWDGQPFFSTSHPINYDDPTAGTFSNYYASGMALTAANYAAVRAAMRTIKLADGRQIDVMPDLLVVPPQLEETGRQILNADFIAPTGGFGQNAAQPQTNTLKGSADLLVVSQLGDDATTWYLLTTKSPIKPFVFQRRKSPTLIPFVNPTDADVFKRRKFTYGSDARGAAGYTLPFLAASASA